VKESTKTKYVTELREKCRWNILFHGNSTSKEKYHNLEREIVQ